MSKFRLCFRALFGTFFLKVCFKVCSLCQWNLDSQFLLVGVRILKAVLRTPKPRIPDFTCKFSQIPDSVTWGGIRDESLGSKVAGLNFCEVFESFLFTPEVEIYFSSSNSFFAHGACGDSFLTNAFAFRQPPSFFSNGDIPNIKAAPLNNLGMAKSQCPRG